MVHLATVDNDAEVKSPVDGLENLKLQTSEEDASASVYGSRFACEGLPSAEMPDGTM